MAFAAAQNQLPVGLWWLFAANLLWVVVYDTQYAMVDREDDLEVGIKSTAILFGEADTRIILLLQLFCLICFALLWISLLLVARPAFQNKFFLFGIKQPSQIQYFNREFARSWPPT